jgi:hypothetical protein
MLFHYARAEPTLDHILGEGRMRLSPFARMNDPREAKEWSVLVTSSDADTGGADLNQISEQFNDLLKWKVKVACFTADRMPNDRGPSALDFGWAHPRMWAHYGDDHAGVALGFRRDRLDELFCGAFSHAPAIWRGEIGYSDADPLMSGAFTIDAAKVRRHGLEEVLDHHATRFYRELFFTKLTDWASENEFRLLMQSTDGDFAHFEYGDALVAVCVGQHWDGTRDAQLLAACERLAITPSKVWWRNGHPELVRYEP